MPGRRPGTRANTLTPAVAKSAMRAHDCANLAKHEWADEVFTDQELVVSNLELRCARRSFFRPRVGLSQPRVAIAENAQKYIEDIIIPMQMVRCIRR